MITPGDKPEELKVFDHGFVRLDAAIADDLSVVNSARVSFAVRKAEMDDRDEGLIKFLMRDRHGTPFEHNSFRFHIRTPIFVAREWFRHRIGCLTGDAVVTFVNTKRNASKRASKTIEQLWEMWTEGERNGQALSAIQALEIERLRNGGLSIRAISRITGIGRRAISTHVRNGTNAFRDASWRVRKMKLRVLNEETNEFEIGHVSDVMDKGVQPVYRVTLADGKQITATENHRFLTDHGWKTLREAVGLIGSGESARMTIPCRLITNGLPAYQDYEWMKEQRQRGLSVKRIAAEGVCSYHTVRKWLKKHDLRFAPSERQWQAGHAPWNRGRSGYRINRVLSDKHLEAIRRARSGEKSNFWRGGISSDRANIGRWATEQAPKVHLQYEYTCQVKICGRRGGRLHAHHIIPVWLDNSRARQLGNLITVCNECHKEIHRTQQSELAFASEFAPFVGFARDIENLPRRKGGKLTGHPVSVIAVEYAGLRQTYDLVVNGPWHNFVANGIVVHNSFNEESARYHKLKDDFYIPQPEAVRSQIGKPGSYSFEPVDPPLADEAIGIFEHQYKVAYEAYLRLVEKGVAKELARSLLPTGIYTQFYWTVNARSLMNFLSLRNSEHAQYEIRIYAQAVERFFAEKMPVTYAAFLDFGRVAP